MNQNLFHFGILLSNIVDKKAFLNAVLSDDNEGKLRVFNGYKGALFSDLTIAQYIESEHRHHTIEITKAQNRFLHTFSSGERRKALLDHCLAQKPDYIIFDSLFDHLDVPSRKELSSQLLELSKSISIIQVEHRKDSVLPFIRNVGYVQDNSFVISDVPEIVQTKKNKIATDFPSSLMSFKKDYETIIKFDKVSIHYDDTPIVTNINWKVQPGEFWQLIGPNGSGKSTLLSMITGDNPKAYGQDIMIFDRKKGSGESIWELKRKIGYFSTNLAELFKRNHTVEQMIVSGFFDSIGLYRKPSGLQQQKAKQWLDVIEMKHLKDSYFNRLPLGQQRLVLIARALIKQPPLLILDEPFEGLDAENVDLVAQLINTLVEKTQITIIYVSHTVEEALAPSHIYELIPTEDGSLGRIKL